ncbi:hypothetical protein HJG60_011649 [Phyllostomus discolor]|uniref:Uncharacterized protein n=1 Tax=Phyllostomus discolor TaxID=89673 RepID=A0A833ZP00_9CHIR|nr:hypothetical protein HJG60_011649 [Phyllostomus discolor]
MPLTGASARRAAVPLGPCPGEREGWGSESGATSPALPRATGECRGRDTGQPPVTGTGAAEGQHGQAGSSTGLSAELGQCAPGDTGLIFTVPSAKPGHTERRGMWDMQQHQKGESGRHQARGVLPRRQAGPPGSGPACWSSALDGIVRTPRLRVPRVSQLEFRTKLSAFLDALLPSRCGV